MIDDIFNQQNMQLDRIFANNDVPLGMAYVPRQRFEQLYTPEVGYTRGTLFERLDLPFIGEEAVPYDR